MAWWWSYLLAAIGILGIHLAGKKKKAGWAVGFGVQFIWIAYAVVTDQYGFIASALAYAFFYGKNYLNWWKEERAGRESRD